MQKNRNPRCFWMFECSNFQIQAVRPEGRVLHVVFLDLQHWEIGIMAGCTISPLAFIMAMDVIKRASRWLVGG